MSKIEKISVAGKALRLLDREPPADYVKQWTQLLAQEREEETGETESVVVFRVGLEWMALPCRVFREFTSTGPIHRIPHRDDRVLLGITSIRGELNLAVSLHALLEIEPASAGDAEKRTIPRLAVLDKDGEVFVVPVDEVHGLYRIASGELSKAPVTVEKSSITRTS